MGLAEVRALLRMSAMVVLHEVDQDDNALAAAIAAKQANDLLAHLADVLGSDVMRDVVAERLSVREMTEYQPGAHEDHNRWSWRGYGHGPAMRDGFRDEADAALAAVREVLGLPGGGDA